MRYRHAALAVLLAATGALAQSGDMAAAVTGLIGQATHATQELDLRLTEAQGAGNRTFAELEPKLVPLLDRHILIAQTLRSAWGLMHSGAGDQEIGFYFVAARAHRALNDRFRGVLDLYEAELPPDAHEHWKKLEDGLSMAVLPGR
jgi:hypothetical protein